MDDLTLVDRGANGGFGDADIRALEIAEGRSADVTGLANPKVKNVTTGTGAAVIDTAKCPIIGIFQAVYDKPARLGGKQRIVMLDGYSILLQFRDGLPYMRMRPPTDSELGSLPHVIFTSDRNWDPTILDLPNVATSDDLDN